MLAQLEALQRGEEEGASCAWRFAAAWPPDGGVRGWARNKTRLVPPALDFARFAELLRAPPFSLLLSARSCTVQNAVFNDATGAAEVQATVVAAEGDEHTFAFRLVQQNGAWRTHFVERRF